MTNDTPESDSANESTLNDRDLLRRFIQDADEHAFAEIVRRYQSLVMSICRRIIGNSLDADDAFQATFVCLARQPKQVRTAASLSSWLYTVAWRTSWRLVRQRRRHPVEPLAQHPADENSDTLNQISSAQECRILDEELHGLPAKYRDVLVMTYFASQTSREIADQLNVSKGTIDGRIREARNMLRVRLARRGVAISVLAIAAGLCSGTTAAASPALVQSTIHLGAQTLSGSLPGTTDLSHLEPFIRPETTMLSSKAVLSTILAATAVVGAAGMSGLVPTDNLAQSDGSTTTLKTDVNPTDEPGEIVFPVATAEQKPANKAGAARGTARQPAAQTRGQNANFGLSVARSVWGGGTQSEATTQSTKAGPSAARFKPYADDAPEIERWMYDLLDKPAPLLDFPGDVPLNEVLDAILAHVATRYGGKNGPDGTNFGIGLYEDKVEFDIEGINSLEDVTVSNIALEGQSLRNALKLIFERTSDPELTYVIEDEVMKITTVNKAESDALLAIRIYDVGELLELDFVSSFSFKQARADKASESGFGGRGGGFFSVSDEQQTTAERQSSSPIETMTQTAPPVVSDQQALQNAHPLAQIIIKLTSPPLRWAEIDGEGGAIAVVGHGLVVRQTPPGHQHVVNLLNQLYKSIR